MRRAILALVALSLIGATLLWLKHQHGEGKSEKAAGDEPHQAYETSARGVVILDEETQKKLGLVLGKATAAEHGPELKGYGRVLDPTPLASLMTELASARAAAVASSNELIRLRTLAAQQNASERALQTSEAAGLRDQLAVVAAKERLVLAWGEGIAELTNLAAFVQSLTVRSSVLVRIDLPVGETLATPPKAALIRTLTGKVVAGEFLGTASHVDPQTLGRGAIFAIRTNNLDLTLGEAVTGHLQLPGEPIRCVLIPSEAVLRAEGSTWVYLARGGRTNFVRTAVELDSSSAEGWCVRKGVSTNDLLVLTGAQALLSEEMKASFKSE